MLTPEQQVEKLSRKPWWSPEPPETYVTDWGVGLGKVAHEDYAAFNLIWAGYKLDTALQHRIATEAFWKQKEANDDVVFDTPLRDWVTLLDPIQFKVWYLINGEALSVASHDCIARALDGLARVHKIQ